MQISVSNNIERDKPADVTIDLAADLTYLPRQIFIAEGVKHPCVVVRVGGEAWRHCEEFSRKSWSGEKTDWHVYGEGLVNSEGDPYLAQRVGFVCEVALAFFLGYREYVLRYKERGDEGWDLTYDWARIDGKGGVSKRLGLWYTCGYYSSSREEVTSVELKADFYARLYIRNDDRRDRYADVVLRGFCSREMVAAAEESLGRGKNGKPAVHRVRKVPLDDLSPIETLKETIERGRRDH